jgi:hypothetical protein
MYFIVSIIVALSHHKREPVQDPEAVLQQDPI